MNNELYIGRYIWNKSKWVVNPDTGKKIRLERPESEWVMKEMPELQIVPHDLWEKVKARQKEVNEKSVNIRAALHKNARTGAAPKYLFSGLLKCGCCGANYIISDFYRYGCSTYMNRGETVCPNAVKVPRKVVESQLLAAIKRDLFTPEGVDLFKQEVRRLLAEKKAAGSEDRK